MTTEGKPRAGAALEALARAMKAELTDSGDGWGEFDVGGAPVVVEVDDQLERTRIHVYFATGSEEQLRSWVGRQPAPRSGLVQVEPVEETDWVVVLVYERATGARDWSSDPMLDDIKQYTEAWDKDTTVQAPVPSAAYEIEEDPRDVPPASAWLLKGTESSYPSVDDLAALRAAASVGVFSLDWTAAAQTQVGDLVLFYFLAPRKSVHFVARAASSAYFSRDVPVQADHDVNQAQWWAYFTPPIEIEPISVTTLRKAAGGYIPLRGRSGLYLRPEVVQSLRFIAASPEDQPELDRIAAVPVGLSHLPDPADVTVDVWRNLAAGALPLEDHVSSYIVEPLLRLLLDGTGLEWQREYPVGKQWADFVILDGGHPVHVIEVKKVAKKGPTLGWSGSPDIHQLRGYADQLGTAATLVDSHRVLLLEKGAAQPAQHFSRRTVTEPDLRAIRQHLLSR